MTPAAVALLIQGIQAAIAAAPQIADVALKAKQFIASLFGAGVISQGTQDKIHAHVDAICAAAIAGQELPEWTVEADPQ